MALILTGWLVGALLALVGLTTVVSIQLRGREPFTRGVPVWLPPVLVFCGAVFLLMTWVSIARSPHEDWNAARTAPAVAWAKGMPLYYPADSGPVTNFIHGPVAAIVRLPAALAQTPTGAIITADTCNAAIFYLPVLLIVLIVRGPWLLKGIGWLVFWGFSNVMPSLIYSAYNVHADAPAVGFAMLACVLVLASARRWHGLNLAVAAVAAACSVGSKQNLGPILLALPAYVWLRHGWKSAVVLTIAEIAAVAAGVGLAVHAFGYDILVYNMITIPAHHPWFLEQFGGFIATLFMSGYLIVDAALPAMLLMLAWLAYPSSPKWSASGLRIWLVRNPWALPLLMGIILVPSSLVGKAKVGGNVNALTPTSYFVVAALAVWLVRYRPGIAGIWTGFRSRVILGGSTAVCIYLALMSLNPWPKLIDNYTELKVLEHNAQQVAYDYANRHAQEVYFPWNPLSTLMATGDYNHFEYGLINLYLAKRPLSRDRLRQGLPRAMRYVIYPPKHQSEATQQLLPDYNVPTQLPDLPGWIVYKRQ